MDACSICGEGLDKEYNHTLKCKHTFHYQCLFLSFKNLKNNNCPYCRNGDNYLPLVNGIKKGIVGIHVKYPSELYDINGGPIYNNIGCDAILKRGINKGDKCGKYCKLGYTKCKIHHK